MTQLLIQIINYNTKDYLDECLNGLFTDLRDFPEGHLTVVLDNNSNDDLTDIEEKYRNERTVFLRSGKNLGFGGGHNYISRKYPGNYFLILNSDLRFIERSTVRRLYERLSADKSLTAIGPKLVLEDMTPQQFDHGALNGFMAMLKNNYGSSYWSETDSERKAAWVSGAVFMCKTEAFNSIGGFDEKFFLYKEEEDLCLRLRKNGGKILYYPQVKVMHIGHVVARRSEHFANSMDYFLDKHFRDKPSFRILDAVKSVKDRILYGRVRERS